MEFTRLADVEVVETANDVDKVLIEQNGEIKRVPKTEVGGSGGGNILVFDLNLDPSAESITGTANMTFDEAIAAINNHELAGAVAYFAPDPSVRVLTSQITLGDYTEMIGTPVIAVMLNYGEMFEFVWTPDGFVTEV